MKEKVLPNQLQKASSVQLSNKQWFPWISTNKLSNLHANPVALIPLLCGPPFPLRGGKCTASFRGQQTLGNENLRFRSAKSMWTMPAIKLDWNFIFPCEWCRRPSCLRFVILFCLRTILRIASARTRLAYAKTHGQTFASASLTRTESSMMLLNVNLASASLPRRLV